jgi:hypothetical protein
MAQSATNVVTAGKCKKIMIDETGIPACGILAVTFQAIHRIFAIYMVRIFCIHIVLPVTIDTFNAKRFKPINGG